MYLKIIKGKNFKNFIIVKDLKTQKDFQIFDLIKTVVFRSEYKPFVQGFNKNISENYLFNEYFIPATFLDDIKTKVSQLNFDLEIIDEDLLYNNTVTEEIFLTWLHSKKFPEDLDLESDTYKFQRDSVYLGLQNKIGKLDVSMSGGKTFISYLYCRYLIENILQPNNLGYIPQILIVCPNTTLIKQLKKDFEYFDKYFERKLCVESIYSGSKKIIDADIVCGTFQSLSNYEPDYFDTFGVFICDELHRAKSYSIRNEIYGKLKNVEYIFGMTGTMPKYQTLDYLHITLMFGKTLIKVSLKDLIDWNVATPIEIKIIEINYLSENEKEFSNNLRNNDIVGLDKYLVEKSFFQSNIKRIKLIGKLLDGYGGKISLITVATVSYCDILLDILSKECPKWTFRIIHGEISTEERDKIISEINNIDSYFCLIGTYGTTSTGLSIKRLEHIYLPDGGKSDDRIKQTFGRIARLWKTKNKGIVFDFFDNIQGSAFKNHGKERIKIYKELKLPYKIIKTEI